MKTKRFPLSESDIIYIPTHRILILTQDEYDAATAAAAAASSSAEASSATQLTSEEAE